MELTPELVAKIRAEMSDGYAINDALYRGTGHAWEAFEALVALAEKTLGGQP